jgi:protein-tyrosine phosphatase
MDRLLVVCTANLVRSPVAEAAFKSWSAREERPEVEITSAGLAATDGLAVPAALLQAIRPYFLDLHAHRSRRVTRDELGTATVVLSMTEAQREALQAMLPAATPRIFSMKEFARLTSGLAPDGVEGGIPAVVQAAHRERPRRPAAGGPEDVTDPYGGSLKQYQECIAEVVWLVDQITGRLS